MCNLYLTGLIQLLMSEIQVLFKHFQGYGTKILVNAYNHFVLFFSTDIYMFHVNYQKHFRLTCVTILMQHQIMLKIKHFSSF